MAIRLNIVNYYYSQWLEFDRFKGCMNFLKFIIKKLFEIQNKSKDLIRCQMEIILKWVFLIKFWIQKFILK